MADFLGYPFDPEIFDYNWQNEPDPTRTALLQSGAVVSDADIARLISTGSDTYTIPFYKTISGDPDNYDGQTNIQSTEATGDSQSGIVFGRAKGFTARDFIKDFNSGADPMRQITSQIAQYWNKRRQSMLIGILNAIFGITDTSFANHTLNLATKAATVTDDNRIGEATIADSTVQAVGDNSGIFTLAVMHSNVAARLAKLDLLEYRKYTDLQGIQRTLRIADINGMLALIDDGVPVTDSATATGSKEYTTYVLGNGVIRTAAAPVEHPSEVERAASINGGQDTLYTRIRETIHPNGFTYTKPTSGYTSSPTDAQLNASARWSRKMDAKSIAIARVITNG
ncbi:major capsid protein [Caproiciproducens galactitolivorans]|uniref:Major capsid protein n=1 Tax=Caproiciproducens galactitolivorans TaxID=642589 RepID=A0ABT4BWE5_9FIRM|nr:major capsid protein [Caproiciproducens galactitolivorans]MCY1715219.1 major capsid protein [Caproiciproducens galactitolivorans]